MTDEKWASAYDLFNEACLLPNERRRAFVENASAGQEIILRVLELLDDAAANSDSNEISRAGTRIGRYLILDRLGRGGMGEVYSARDMELERIVALKFLSPDLQSPHLIERFVREAKAASALNHPNIVTVYEVAASDSCQAIAMELVDGQAIRVYCGAPVSAWQVAAWGRQIAQALAAAHSLGIVHRDIKPENLMVRGDGYVKVLDFGLARRGLPGAGSKSTNLSGMFGGTWNYMSPEQTRGERATAASDIFSLGIVLFELATGRHPFLRDSPIDTAHAIAHDKPTIPVNVAIPPPLERTIAAMLTQDPRQRPTAVEVEQRLAAIGPETANGTRTAAAPPKRRTIALLVLGVCAASAFGLWTLREREPASLEPATRQIPRQITRQASENRVTAAALSPDGKTLAFASLGEPIQLRRMSDGFNQAVATPKVMHVNRIAWFRDGSKLLVSGFVAGARPSGIWIISAGGGQPALVMPAGDDGVPSPDGTRIAFTSDGGGTIWVAGTAGGAARQVRGGGITGSFSALVWSSDSKRISYQNEGYAQSRDGQAQANQTQLEASNTYTFESVEVETGRVVASVRDLVMTSAYALPDGRILFLRWVSVKSVGERQLWELPTDPRTGVVSGPLRLLARQNDFNLSSVSASDDGKHVAVVWHQDEPNIYVAELPAEDEPVSKLLNIRRLTFSLAFDFPHAWTPDSRTVIFESSRNGHYDLFRQSIYRRDADPLVVSATDKVLAQVSPDGKWILYREGPKDRHALMRAPLEGGHPEPIAGAAVGEFRCGLRPGSRCVLRSVENDQFLFYELDPVRGKGRELARTVWSPTITGDWDISPDGRAVAIPNHSPRDATIRVVQLEGSGSDLPEKTVRLEGLKHLNGLVWAANGREWYVCARNSAGSTLNSVDQQGRSRELLQLSGNTYAVPSPDGRRIAFPQPTVSSNVFMLDGLPSR